jgi:hypothetical protein
MKVVVAGRVWTPSDGMEDAAAGCVPVVGV